MPRLKVSDYGSRTVAGNRFNLRSFSYCGKFNGSDNYVSKLTETAFNLTNYSIVMWVKGGRVNNDFKIYSEGSSSSNTPRFYISARNTGAVTIVITADDNTTILNATSTSKKILNGEWHQIVWTDANGTAKLYIDGVVDATSFSYTRSGTFTLNRTGIGTFLRNSPSNFYNGLIDQVQIFNAALSQDNITELYYQNKTPNGLILEWLFDQGTGSTVTDTSVSATNGTWQGTLGSQWSQDVFMTPRTIAA